MMPNNSYMRNCTASNQVYNTRNNSNCSRLKLRLQQVEFALNDVVLYLDAYPECYQALEYYHNLMEERNDLLGVINEECGPMTNYSNLSKESWLWTNGPWPWQIDA